MANVVDATTTGVTTWQIDPSHTTVELAVKHLMFATAKARFASVKGTITLDERDLARSAVMAEIDAATVETGDQKRDGHLRSGDFLDVETHPALTFTSTRVEPLGDDRLRVHGDLTIRGTTRPIVLDTEITGRGVNPWGAHVIGFSATTTINRSDYGLNWNVALETGGVLVGDTVKISIDVEANRQG
jgi:polyisoprenoid-binding protein YceI